jgi:hypothetical protein
MAYSHNELPAPATLQMRSLISISTSIQGNFDLRLHFLSFRPISVRRFTARGYNAAMSLCETWRRWDLAIALLHPMADVVSCLDTDGQELIWWRNLEKMGWNMDKEL